MLVRYSAFGATNVGKVRDHNEDAFYVSPEGGYFIVSDGMGGLAAGEIASAVTRETIIECFENSFASTDSVEKLMKEAFSKANEAVRKKLSETNAKKGMGCTCVVLAFRDNDFFVGYVGDSRIYLFRSGKLKQLTRDHSYVEELFLRGLITEEEKKDHPYKNSITRYVGHAEQIEVDISSGPVSNGDEFLLCSDGLTGEVEDKGIEDILKSKPEPEAQANALVEQALENGGGDNVTVVVVKVEKKSPGFFKKLFNW
jgi:protein phosphatase